MKKKKKINKIKKDNKDYNYKAVKIYKLFPVDIGEEIAIGVQNSCRRKHKLQKIKMVLNTLFSKIACEWQADKFDTNWFFDDFGTFKLNVRPKMIYITEPPTYKDNCKRIRFAFAPIFRRKYYRVLNTERLDVIKYLNTKKWNRRMIIRYVRQNKKNRKYGTGNFATIPLD
jgi:hypothetical protein